METLKTERESAAPPVPYKSRVDNSPLTAKEQALWWVMGIMGLSSMLLLFVLLILSHSSLAAN